MMSRVNEAERALDLPPGYTPVLLRESGDAFAHGLDNCGASWGRNAGLGRALRPRRACRRAGTRRATGISAACAIRRNECDRRCHRGALSTRAGSQFCVARFSNFFDGGLLGGVRLGWPEDCAETDVPAWLVLGVMLRAVDLVSIEPGAMPGTVSLMGEGFEMVQTEAIVGSFARHLMIGFDQWNEAGFDPVASNYLARLPKNKAGERRGIDRNGDLLINAPFDMGAADRTSLLEGLSRAAWYDPGLRGPKVA